MYHSIQTVDRREVMRSLHVRPRSFLNQMRLLKMLGYRGCSVSEIQKALTAGSDEKLVALTFDDGYSNFFVNALPILKNFRFTATVYVISGLIGGTNIWDRKSGISENSLMNHDQIRFCSDEGDIEIGCHAMSHKSLIDESIVLSTEIDEAKARLEDWFGKDCLAFCYPYGHFNQQVVDAVKNAGFSSGTTMLRGRVTKDHDMMLLPRIPVTWHTLPHLFLAKLLTNYEDKRYLK